MNGTPIKSKSHSEIDKSTLKAEFCGSECAKRSVEEQYSVFFDDGECTCGCHRHHWHCVCGKITQVG